MSVHDRMESIADVYVAGGLGVEERRETEWHLASCPACAGLVEDARGFASWMRGAVAADAPPADLEEHLIASFRSAGSRRKGRFVVLRRYVKGIAGVAALFGLVALGNAFTVASGNGLEHLAAAESDSRSSDRDEANAREERRATRGILTITKAPRGLYNKYSGLAGGGQGQTGASGSTLLFGLQNSDSGIGGALSPPLGPKSIPEPQTAASASLKAGGDVEKERAEELKDALALGDEAKVNLGRRQAPRDLANDAKGVRPEEPASRTPAQDDRKIIRNAELSLEVDSYAAAYAKLAPLVAAEKGEISNANVQKLPNGKIRATLTLRVPPERFEALIARCSELGTVRHQDIGSQDVTKTYVDLQSRLRSKETLAERLRKLLAEGKGTVKDLMEVEVQMGVTIEAIEQIKGEIKYYDNLVGRSTITLHLSEKDLGQPFEFVQTLQGNLALTARDPDDAYAKAQNEIVVAGGQVVDSRMTRQSDGSSAGTIRGRVEAEKFPALREALKALGTVTNDTVNQQKTAHGGQEGSPRVDAPLRKELAVVDLVISSPQLFVTRRSQLVVETDAVESAYQNARRAVEGAGGRILDGSLTGATGGSSATLKAQVDVDRFGALVESLKSSGKVKNATVNQVLPSASSDGLLPLLRERAEIELSLVSPPPLLTEEHGLLRTLRETLAGSWAGILWSIQRLFVGISLAGPWIAVLAGAWLLWKRLRRKKGAQA